MENSHNAGVTTSLVALPPHSGFSIGTYKPLLEYMESARSSVLDVMAGPGLGEIPIQDRIKTQ